MTSIQNSCANATTQRSSSAIEMISGWTSAIVGLVPNRIKRAEFRQMLTLDDRILTDIGVTRGDVYWASELPLNVDASEALHRESRMARRKKSCIVAKMPSRQPQHPKP